MDQQAYNSPEQPQQQNQALPSRETFYGYLATNVDTRLSCYGQIITWMTEKGGSLFDLEHWVQEQRKGLPRDSSQANENQQVVTILHSYREQLPPYEQCVTRRLLPCPSQSVCRGKTTEHFMIGEYYECQECGCRQHWQKLGQITFRPTDLEEWWLK